MPEEKGLLIVYTGPGKGKTTCALGTAFRAVGQGLRVLMVQFIKGSWHYGELDAAKMLGDDKFEIRPMGRGFVKIGGAETDPQDIKLAEECWQTGRDAIYGGIPSTADEAGLKQFSALMKLEPFQRGMKELAPTVWITALRKVQNPNRAGLDIVSEDKNFGALKVSPVFYWSDADMETYLKQHQLPNEWDYFDPAKADDKRECGLHATWGSQTLGSGI